MTTVLWGERATAPLHIVHFGYAIGTILGPVVAAPFQSQNMTSCDVTLNTMTLHVNAVRIPFSIIGAQGLFTALLFVSLIFFIPRTTTSSTPTAEHTLPLRQRLSPGTCAGGNTCFGVTLLALSAVLYFFLTGKEQPVFAFIYAMALDRVKPAFTKEHANLVTTAFYVSYSGGRLLGAVIGHFVRIQVWLHQMSINLAMKLTPPTLYFRCCCSLSSCS